MLRWIRWASGLSERFGVGHRRHRVAPRTPWRPDAEGLEQRQVLTTTGLGALSWAIGQIDQVGRSQPVNLQLDGLQFTPGQSGSVLVAIDAEARPGSAVQPEVTGLTLPGGRNATRLWIGGDSFIARDATPPKLPSSLGVDVVSLQGTGAFVASAYLPGDVNRDQTVDQADLDEFRPAFGSKSGQSNFEEAADFNQDGRVGQLDLELLKANWGARAIAQVASPPVTPTPTPTPTPAPTPPVTPPPTTVTPTITVTPNVVTPDPTTVEPVIQVTPQIRVNPADPQPVITIHPIVQIEPVLQPSTTATAIPTSTTTTATIVPTAIPTTTTSTSAIVPLVVPGTTTSTASIVPVTTAGAMPTVTAQPVLYIPATTSGAATATGQQFVWQGTNATGQPIVLQSASDGTFTIPASGTQSATSNQPIYLLRADDGTFTYVYPTT